MRVVLVVAVLSVACSWPVRPAVAQADEGAQALEAEIERARAEEEAEAALLRGASIAAPDSPDSAAPIPPLHSDPLDDVEAMSSATTSATRWDHDLDDQLRDHRVSAEWHAAWHKLSRDRNFQESSCFPSGADLVANSGDRFRYRRLTREDFRARRKSRDARLAVAMPNSVTGAHVATSIVCIGRLRAEEVTRGRFAVWFEELEYVALLDPNGSWWNPKAKTHPEWILRHEQLHFDVTELVARRHNADRLRHALALKVVADSPEEAMQAFGVRWSAHFRAILAEWFALQDQYDRETRHGTVPKQQTAWFARIHREMATLSAAAH